MIHDLQGQGIDTVFFVGEGEQAAQWIQAAEGAEWTPRVFVLGPLMDENILAAPARFQGKIFAAYPQLQPELGAVDQFEEFLQRHKLTHDHRLLQISAYSAAKILEDALDPRGQERYAGKTDSATGANARLQDGLASGNYVWSEAAHWFFQGRDCLRGPGVALFSAGVRQGAKA